MQEHQLVVIAGPAREVLARIIAVSIPEDSELVGLRFSRPAGSEMSRTLLTVRVPTPKRLDLLVARVGRLVAVRSVVVLEAAHRNWLWERDGLLSGRVNDQRLAPTPRWSTSHDVECYCGPMQLRFRISNFRIVARRWGSTRRRPNVKIQSAS